MAELKENILNILEEKGIINNFKSELRAQVLKAMGQFTGKKDFLEKPDVLQQLQNPDAQLCLEIIWDFLEYSKLKNTLEIFIPECNLKKRSQRYDLESKIGIKGDPGKPILLRMIEKCKNSEHEDKSPEGSVELPPNKFFEKNNQKIPDIGLVKPKDQLIEKKAPLNTFGDLQKPVEKQPNPLTSLPKPTDKANDRLKLQPLSNPKKNINLRSFDVLIDEDKIIKHDESPKSSIEEDIDEEVEEDHKEFYESQGTSSMGVDASVNSLALEDFDHIEPIRPPKKR